MLPPPGRVRYVTHCFVFVVRIIHTCLKRRCIPVIWRLARRCEIIAYHTNHESSLEQILASENLVAATPGPRRVVALGWLIIFHPPAPPWNFDILYKLFRRR